MDRKALLKKVLYHLGEAIHAIELHADRDDENAAIWNGLMAVNGTAEAELNQILINDTKKDKV